jgi:hypothetical protein
MTGLDTTNHNIKAVLFTGNNVIGNTPPKTITFYNNSVNTIYPFLYDPNTGKSTTGNYYDPLETGLNPGGHNEEFREYVGYTKEGMDYFGLQPGAWITIPVPLVFWDSGRFGIATDKTNLLPADKNTDSKNQVNNPFHFLYKNPNGTNTARAIIALATDQSKYGNGVVMYYHALGNAEDPASDAPDQLGEFTIRDQKFLTLISNHYGKIADDQLKTLVNYDVSYVDHLLAPVAMEGLQVPVPNTTVAQDYGWIGAQQDYIGNIIPPAPPTPASLQGAIQRFTSKDPAISGLGTYFDGRGWPTFFNPNYNADNPQIGVRIPGGANIIFDSPLGILNNPSGGARSSYTQPFGPGNHWMLSSGGDNPIALRPGGTLQSDSQTLSLSADPNFGLNFFNLLKTGTWIVTTNNRQGVVMGQIDNATVDAANMTVKLKTKAQNGYTPGNYSFIISPPVTDPYATKLTNLWYSWATYYQNLPRFKNLAPQDIQATVSADTDSAVDTRILTFAAPQTALSVGMQVTGAGITNLTTILKISSDLKTVYLSTPVPVASGQTRKFTFSVPAPIAFAGETLDLHISFAMDSQTEKQTAALFSGVVYELLSVYSTVNPRKVPDLPGSVENVGNSIGGNVGFLPTATYGATKANLKNISADVRDLGKSALRGVPDFSDTTKYPPATAWYPDPAKGTGNQTYNVFNLDPYVWFVHKIAHLSGYGFSFDDDTADVGANGATKLAVTFSGLNGLTNTSEWGPSTQWGTKKSFAMIFQGNAGEGTAGKTVIQLNDPIVYNQVSADDPKNGLIGAYVSGPGITKRIRLLATAVINKNQFILSDVIPDNSGEYTFSAKPLI